MIDIDWSLKKKNSVILKVNGTKWNRRWWEMRFGEIKFVIKRLLVASG